LRSNFVFFLVHIFCATTINPSRLNVFHNNLSLPPFLPLSLPPSYIADLNENITSLPSLGPASAYLVSSEDPPIRGKLELEWIGEGENGIAVKLETEGNKALTAATKDVLGSVVPYSITGSLPLVRYLQDNDFDVQLVGYGKSSKYHADNEAADLKDFKQAIKILARVMARLETE
jgi:acetylornithine deacetylase